MAPKAIVGASMRRLVHLIYGVLTSGQVFNPEIPLRALAIEDGPLYSLVHVPNYSLKRVGFSIL